MLDFSHYVIAGLTGNLMCYASTTEPKVAAQMCIEDGILSHPSVWRNLWKKFLKDCQLHPKHSSELLVGGVVAKVHVAGGVYLLLGTELRGSLD